MVKGFRIILQKGKDYAVALVKSWCENNKFWLQGYPYQINTQDTSSNFPSINSSSSSSLSSIKIDEIDLYPLDRENTTTNTHEEIKDKKDTNQEIKKDIKIDQTKSNFQCCKCDHSICEMCDVEKRKIIKEKERLDAIAFENFATSLGFTLQPPKSLRQLMSEAEEWSPAQSDNESDNN